MAYTPISQLGEFGLIEHLTHDFPQFYPNILQRVGDDAAIVKCGDGKVQVFTTDLLIEGVHFDLSYSPLRHLGYKSVIVNLSDILAMNAMPYGITVSVAISSRFTVEAMEELYAGIKLACEKYHVELLGGDTNSSQHGMMISVSAFGEQNEADIVYRRGAQPKDLICVTGDLGAAYAGFLILDREKTVFLDQPEQQPDLNDYDYVVGRQLKPELAGTVLSELRTKQIKATAMMDISDGLGSEIHHICRQSQVGATIYSNKIPIDHQTVKVAEEFDISPTTFALNGGEDYELLFTVPLSSFKEVANIPSVSIIGHITDDPQQVQIILDTGQAVDIEAQGWQHFNKSST